MPEVIPRTYRSMQFCDGRLKLFNLWQHVWIFVQIVALIQFIRDTTGFVHNCLNFGEWFVHDLNTTQFHVFQSGHRVVLP